MLTLINPPVSRIFLQLESNTVGVFKEPRWDSLKTGERETHISPGWGSFRLVLLGKPGPPASLDSPSLRGQLPTPDRMQICWYLRDWRIKWSREAPSTQPHPLTAGSLPLGVSKSIITSWALLLKIPASLQSQQRMRDWGQRRKP